MLLGCQDRKESDFKNYYEKLPLLKTPLSLKSGMIEEYEVTQRKDSILFNKLSKLGSDFREKYFPSKSFFSLYGRIYEKENFISIIYRCDADKIWPYLYTFTKQGEIIDSLSLNNSTGIDVLGSEISTTLIDDKMNIVLKNEATYNDMNPNSNKDIDFKEIKYAKYSLDKSGKFKKIEEKIDTIK